MNLSLNSRLLLAASVASVVFLGVTGLVLDGAFRSSAETAVQNHLRGQLYALLAAAELDAGDQLQVPASLPEARFSRVRSGLYGRVLDAAGREIWRSPSLLGQRLPAYSPLPPGASLFEKTRTDGDVRLFWLRFGVAWERGDQIPVEYEFTVAEDLANYAAQVSSFRHSLWLWLGGAVVVLLAVQAGVLRWSLTPLRQVSEDITAVERGQAQQLSGDYPKELSGLTRNINAFIANERRQIDRYRNTLGDLAHSLKTPLAVVRGMVDSAQVVARGELATQVDRMSEIVEYQLRRAAAAGQRTLAKPVAVATNVDKLINSLRKVYADKPLTIDHQVAPDLRFHGDRGDLLEVLGNLLDNAFKWSRRCVAVSVQPINDGPGRRNGLRLVVTDDGPGIDGAMREQVMNRGVRLDGRTEGQGLGLATVKDIVDAYGGRLQIAPEAGHGTEIVVEFPAS